MYTNIEDARYPRAPGELRDIHDVRRLFDGYDCGIAYMDEQIGQLFAGLKEKGVWDDLAIIISSDHGENMGELGIYAEHATADSSTCRIPLIIRWPSGRRGVNEGLHYNLDLAPTLSELLGVPAPARWDGNSFAGEVLANHNKGLETDRSYLVLSQCAHVCQRSVRWGPWLYMRTYHCGYHLFPGEMLYNLEQDPHLQNDLAVTRHDLCQQGGVLLMQWQDDMLANMPDGYCVDPMRTVLTEGGPTHTLGDLAGYLERLRTTGRAHHAAALERRYGKGQQA